MKGLAREVTGPFALSGKQCHGLRFLARIRGKLGSRSGVASSHPLSKGEGDGYVADEGFNQDAIGQAMIQTDAPAALGSSGGPASGDDPNVIGSDDVRLLFGPAAAALVQRFNFLIPGPKDVLKFLSGTEVTDPGQSPFNPVWAAVLRTLGRVRPSLTPKPLAGKEELPFTPGAAGLSPMSRGTLV